MRALRKSVLGEIGALLLPAQRTQCNLPVCTRCGCYCAIELVEVSAQRAKVLVTCKRHRSSSGNWAQQTVEFRMVDDEWNEEDLGKLVRGVAWFSDSVRNEGFAGIE